MTDLAMMLDALNASTTTLKRDFHLDHGYVGDYAIRGRYGHIYQDGAGWLLCVHTGASARRWTSIKDKLAFCRLTQDGDDEGCLHLDRLPTQAEAELIRETLAIRKRRTLSPDAKHKARAALERFRASLNEPFPVKDASNVLVGHPRRGRPLKARHPAPYPGDGPDLAEAA